MNGARTGDDQAVDVDAQLVGVLRQWIPSAPPAIRRGDHHRRGSS
jgi:hypothetical protein